MKNWLVPSLNANRNGLRRPHAKVSVHGCVLLSTCEIGLPGSPQRRAPLAPTNGLLDGTLPSLATRRILPLRVDLNLALVLPPPHRDESPSWQPESPTLMYRKPSAPKWTSPPL